MRADTIPARLLKQAQRQPERPAYFVKQGQAWRSTSWAEYAREVRAAAKSMIALGVEPGGGVTILGFNRPEWVVFDLAAMMVGAAPAGIYTTCSPPEVRYIVDHAESPVVLLEDAGQWAKIKAERENLPKLKWAVMMKGAPKIDDPMVLDWEEFLAQGAAVSDEVLDGRLDAVKPDDLATLIYTSGTTGPPKGVMLSHRNLTWTADCALKIVTLTHEDCSLSYLPLSHIAEQMFTLHAPITAGSAVYYAESIAKVPDNLKEVRPTVLFAVPRIWEKFHAGVSAKMAESKGAKAKIASWALGVGRKACDARNHGRAMSPLLSLQYKLANKAVFSKVKAALGLDRARICVSGAAPIAKEVLEFFTGLDLIVHEVYGQSEDTGPTSFNMPGATRIGTVGKVIPGAEVKIADDGEILVRGPNVFLGYYKEPAATGETLIDGWLHSGDLGSFDAEGFLSITGRKKEIIITAGGKNIAPKNIEAAIKHLPLVSEAVVIGDRRKFLVALVTLHEENAAKWAAERGAAAKDLHKNADLVAELQRFMDQEVNPQFAQVESVKKFTVLHRQFTIDDGELTPTLKIKRKKVNEHFAAEIEAMYAE
jgi:long-chain acyl-CoA synthetase